MARDRILQIYRGTTAQNNAFTGAQGELTMDTDRKEIRIHDGSTAGGNVVGLTPGFIAPFAGSTAPDGWLVCDGSAISRTRYADLFAVIGTTYGSGDGNTTFNLPTANDFPCGYVDTLNGETLELPTSGNLIAITKNGILSLVKDGGTSKFISLERSFASTIPSTSSGLCRAWYPTIKNTSVYVYYTTTDTGTLKFYPDIGTPSIIKY